MVTLNISDPHAPKPVSVLQFEEKQSPHWLAYENASSRIVMANAGVNTESRLWMLNIEVASGVLSIDEKFATQGAHAPECPSTAKNGRMDELVQRCLTGPYSATEPF